MRFTKMHGLGNDFVVLDATREPIALDAASARAIADRHFGIGCDQILIVEPPRRDNADFGYRILNSDGSESGQCGNGARCFARYVREQGLTDKDRVVVDVRDGQMVLESLGDHHYRVALGVPVFDAADIPLRGFDTADEYRLDEVAGRTLRFAALAIGNPHAVLRVEDIDRADVAVVGPALESHPAFPERVNVGFMQVLTPDRIRLRVYERGAGETLACGSGAAAAAVSGIRAGVLDSHVAVELPGGTAHVDWAGHGKQVYLSGPAERVFDGELVLSNTSE
ncbi:diaminopimelate epimerase [Salinisphaera sp. S4-8]|uniref:diaminopimelate epimerase n=1 Tax=Salinisphaera sp. S4-8 TaxID=633357 RepID=UPI00333FB265